MAILQPDPDSALTTPDAILRRLSRIAAALGVIENVMTDISGRLQQPPGPPVIPILSQINTESLAISSIAVGAGGGTDRTPIDAAPLFTPPANPAVTPDAALVVVFTIVSTVLARLDERLAVIAGVMVQQPPGPPVIPVLSTINAEAQSIGAIASRLAASGTR
jgi:hypothetical protein